MSQLHHLLLACFKVSAPWSFHGQERKALLKNLIWRRHWNPSSLAYSPKQGSWPRRGAGMRRHPRGYPRATGCAARWLQSSAGGLGGRSPSQVPHPQCPLQTEATAAQEHSLETKYGKSCGSRASVLSYVGKFHQSSFPLQCYLDLQCPSEHSECRTAKLLQEQEGRWSRALHQLLLYHDDGCSENWEEMQGFFCGAIWKHLKVPVCVLIAGLLYSSNAFKHQYPATHGDCEHYFIHCAICFLLVRWNDAMFHILFLPMTAATGLRKLLRAAWAVSSKHSHLGRHLGSRGRQVCSCQPPIPTGKTLHSQQKEPPGMLSHLRGLPGLLLTA